MRKLLTIAVTAVAALSLTATGFADPGGEKKAKKHGKYTFTVTTTDNGSCGQPWANDVVRRTFQVKKNKDGSYPLTRRDRGAFTTIGGASPGSCDTTGNHGATVVAGVKGKLVGYIRGTVTGGTFNPNATCTGAGLRLHRRLHHRRSSVQAPSSRASRTARTASSTSTTRRRRSRIRRFAISTGGEQGQGCRDDAQGGVPAGISRPSERHVTAREKRPPYGGRFPFGML